MSDAEAVRPVHHPPPATPALAQGGRPPAGRSGCHHTGPPRRHEQAGGPRTRTPHIDARRARRSGAARTARGSVRRGGSRPRAPPAPAGSPAAALQAIADRIAACRKCGLCDDRTRTVPGQGHAQPDILFVGEGPGRDEDQQGLAFVGRAGQLLTRIVVAMGLTRDDVFIANIVKCRPTEDGQGEKDRPPTRGRDGCLPALPA
jgi:hypothetical protein